MRQLCPSGGNPPDSLGAGFRSQHNGGKIADRQRGRQKLRLHQRGNQRPPDLPKLIRKGNLAEIFNYLDNPEERQKDAEGFTWAKAEYAAAEKLVYDLEHGQVDRQESAILTGRQAGAAGGFDAVQALAQAPGLALEVDIVAPERCASFHVPVREAAARLPHGVNLAVAAALAGPGLDETMVRLTADPDPTHHAIRLRASSALGGFESRLLPVTDPSCDLHVVAAAMLAALRQASQVIWVG